MEHTGSPATPDITSSTIFEAVLAAVQGLYLLHDQPGVIKNKLGVTGISWGGYMTTMLSGLASPLISALLSLLMAPASMIAVPLL